MWGQWEEWCLRGWGVCASEEAGPREPERVVIKGPTTWSKSWLRHVVACDLG